MGRVRNAGRRSDIRAGDLLRARGDSKSSGHVYHAMGATTFDDVPVNYDVFKGMLKGVVALGLVGFNKGRILYRKTGERIVLDRRATAFWATDRLVKLAEHFGVQLENIRDHFKPEPPHNPLVLRGPGERIGRKKVKGPIIKYKHDEHSRELEADIKELNAFLAGHEISGGEHQGYTRNFNNGSWRRTTVQHWRRLPADVTTREAPGDDHQRRGRS